MRTILPRQLRANREKYSERRRQSSHHRVLKADSSSHCVEVPTKPCSKQGIIVIEQRPANGFFAIELEPLLAKQGTAKQTST